MFIKNYSTFFKTVSKTNRIISQTVSQHTRKNLCFSFFFFNSLIFNWKFECWIKCHLYHWIGVKMRFTRNGPLLIGFALILTAIHSNIVGAERIEWKISYSYQIISNAFVLKIFLLNWWKKMSKFGNLSSLKCQNWKNVDAPKPHLFSFNSSVRGECLCIW